MKISNTIQHCENKQEHSQINIYGMRVFTPSCSFSPSCNVLHASCHKALPHCQRVTCIENLKSAEIPVHWADQVLRILNYEWTPISLSKPRKTVQRPLHIVKHWQLPSHFRTFTSCSGSVGAIFKNHVHSLSCPFSLVNRIPAGSTKLSGNQLDALQVLSSS